MSPYSEGGALFALGLIHASHGQPVVEFISNSLSNTNNEVVQHGACLGLGLASQGSDDVILYEKLKGAKETLTPSWILGSILCTRVLCAQATLSAKAVQDARAVLSSAPR